MRLACSPGSGAPRSWPAFSPDGTMRRPGPPDLGSPRSGSPDLHRAPTPSAMRSRSSRHPAARPRRLLLALWTAALGLLAAAAPAAAAAPPAPGAALAGVQEPDAQQTVRAAAEQAAEQAAEGIPAEAPGEGADEGDWQDDVDRVMGDVNGAIAAVIFFDLWWIDNETTIADDGTKTVQKNVEVPFAVLWLIFGAVFFTLRMGFINLRGFRHAIDVVRGKYSDPSHPGEVTHFQALSAALSATVGLGNIASVAIAVSMGGPGATFWMILAGVLGMSSKFTECTLGQRYREVRPDGHVMGGAMHYLSKGLAEKGLGGLGMVLAVVFSILCIGGSLAGGNSFQVNQSLGAVSAVGGLEFLAPADQGGEGMGWIYGALMTVMVGIVIVGGIRRIAQVAEKIVPTMCGIYVAACLFILATHFGDIPDAFRKIVTEAFDPQTVFDMDALKGGMVGVLILGFKRAAFSNEAGIGSAAIAHSAAKTEYPVREGVVALLEPFIDTVVVCTMTALVIVITGVYNDPTHAELITGADGAALTSAAFGEKISWFPYVLAVATMLFAFSTMISWSYYGERCWSWLFGERSSLLYKALFLTFTFLGSIITARNVLEFGDLMILGMALPNILGVLLLSGVVRRDLTEYWDKYKKNEFKIYK